MSLFQPLPLSPSPPPPNSNSQNTQLRDITAMWAPAANHAFCLRLPNFNHFHMLSISYVCIYMGSCAMAFCEVLPAHPVVY